jgi:hypothetical protein
MASPLLLLQQLRQYILQPDKKAASEVKDLAHRLLGFPPELEESTRPVFEQRQRELVDLVTQQGKNVLQLAELQDLQTPLAACALGLDEEGTQLSELHELQTLLASCALGLDEEGKQRLGAEASALLRDRWEAWDPCGLWGQLQGSLQTRDEPPPPPSGPRFLEKLLAVDALRLLPEEAYLKAAEELEHEPRVRNASIVLPNGTYSWLALDRVYFVLQRMMASSSRHAWNSVLPCRPQSCEEYGVQDAPPPAPSPWQRDLVCLQHFAECVLARAHAWSRSRDPVLVSEVRKQLEKLSSLSIHGKVSTPDACAATVNLLRFFCRAVLRYLYALPPDSPRQTSFPLPPQEEQMLAELRSFEDQLFQPRYPSDDFPQRLPALLLGRAWGIVYPRLAGLVARGAVDRAALLGPSFDQAKLLHLLPEEDRAAGRSLVCNLQSLFKDTLEEATGRKHRGRALLHPLLDLMQFEAEDAQAVWRDEAATEVLLNFAGNQKKFSFLPPLFYGLRVEQLHRELPSAGAVLLFWQATPASHERILEHPVRAPFELEVLEANHPRIFKCLPLGSAELELLGEEALSAATERYACFLADMGHLTGIQRRQLQQRGDVKIVPAASQKTASGGGSRYLSKEVVEALRRAHRTGFLEVLASLPELSCPALPMERLRAVLFSAEDPAALAGRGILGLGLQQRRDFLKRLPRDQPVPVFAEERRGDVVFYQRLRRSGSFHPCYCSGVALRADWSARETELLRSWLKAPALKKAAELLLHGARAVLFSDAPSGLLREERVCRLPLLCSKRKELVELLHRRGVALYFWCVSRSFKPQPEVRFLELEMLFDESENVYDWGALHRKSGEARSAVERHVRRCLRRFSPGEESFSWTARSSASRALLVLTRSEAPRREELQLASSEQVSVLVLGGRLPQPRPLASFHESRSFNEACLGQGCARIACREIRGLCRPLVCEACDAWEPLQARGEEACQYLLEDGASCSAPASVQLRGCEQRYPRLLCSSHAVLAELEPGVQDRTHLQEDGPLLWKEVPASLGVRRRGTYPTSYCRKEDARTPAACAEPALHEECLEVQELLKHALTSWLAKRADLVQGSKLLLCLGDRTKDLLDASLSEAFPSTTRRPLVCSLESHEAAKSPEHGLLQLLGSEELLGCFLDDAGGGRRGEEPPRASLGEIPASSSAGGDDEASAEEEEPREAGEACCSSKALATYCERKGLSKQSRERTSVLRAIQAYVSAVDDFFGSSRHPLLQVFELPLPGKKKQRWTEQVTLGWILAFQALAAAERVTKKRRSKNGASWLACLQAVLRSRQLFLRTRAAWRLVAALPSLLEEQGPRAVLARLVSRSLLFSREPSSALQELRDVQGGLLELYELHRTRSGLPELALGVLRSCLEGLEESLEASGRSFVTPLEFLRLVVLPRAQLVADFEQVTELLFARHPEASARRPALDVPQATQLAQTFFWNQASRTRLRSLALEIERRFAEARLPVPQQSRKLGRCFCSGREAPARKKAAGARCSASRLLSNLEALQRQLGAQGLEEAPKKRRRLADAVSEA